MGDSPYQFLNYQHVWSLGLGIVFWRSRWSGECLVTCCSASSKWSCRCFGYDLVGGFGGQLEDAEMLEDVVSSKVFILINDGTFLGFSFLEGVESLLEVSFFLNDAAFCVFFRGRACVDWNWEWLKNSWTPSQPLDLPITKILGGFVVINLHPDFCHSRHSHFMIFHPHNMVASLRKRW